MNQERTKSLATCYLPAYRRQATTYSDCYLQFRRPSAGVPPLPIPNREVKPCSADGTGVTPGRVGRRHIIEALRRLEGLFVFSRNTKYEVRNTRYEIRDTKYEIRDTIFY